MKCICCKDTLRQFSNSDNYYCGFPECPYYHLSVSLILIRDVVKSIRRVRISKKDIDMWIKKWSGNKATSK